MGVAKYVFFLVWISAWAQSFSYEELVAISTPEQIEALQEAAEPFHFTKETQFESLEGGLTRAKVYSFAWQDEQYVLRFLALGPNQTQQRRQEEIRAHDIGHRLALAPPCLFSDANRVLMILPFLPEGSPHMLSISQLQQLGRMLHTLHHFSGDYPHKYPFHDRLKRHYEKGLATNVAYPTGLGEEVRALFNRPASRPLVPTHGDLNPSNILLKGEQLFLIDWTNATWDDPFTELGYFSQLSHLTQQQEEIFLAAYLGRAASMEELQALREEKRKVNLLTAVIWLRFSETEEERRSPLAPRVAALDAELHSSTLKKVEDYHREGVVVNWNTSPLAEVRSYALSVYKAYLEGIVE